MTKQGKIPTQQDLIKNNLEFWPAQHWISKELYEKFHPYVWEKYFGEELEIGKNLFLE